MSPTERNAEEKGAVNDSDRLNLDWGTLRQ
jgi:hypothetical protein